MLKDASIYTLPSRYSDEDDQSLNPISIPSLLRRLLISIHKRHTHRITYWGYKQYVLVPHYKRTLSWVQTCDILACHSYVNVTVSLTRCWCGWYLFVTRSSTVTLSQASEEIAEYKVTLWVCRRRVVSWIEPTKKRCPISSGWPEYAYTSIFVCHTSKCTKWHQALWLRSRWKIQPPVACPH